MRAGARTRASSAPTVCDSSESALGAPPSSQQPPYDGGMKKLPIVGLLLVLVAMTSSAFPQSTDWQVLAGIPAGTKIKLIFKHKRTFGPCQFETVTEAWLGCYFTALGSRRYARDEIREVRLGHQSARTGFFIGAGAGAILGAAHGAGGSDSRVLGLIVLTPVLAGLGAGVGAIADPFVHGRTLYRSPDMNGANTAPQASTINSIKLCH
jgi:hypothetical protein